MTLILFFTFALLILCKFYKQALLYTVGIISIFMAILSLVYSFAVFSHWFYFAKGLSIIIPTVIYCWVLHKYSPHSVSPFWLSFFLWVLRINIFEAVILSLQVMPHNFFLYSNFIFLLISTCLVPKKQYWKFDNFVGGIGFSDMPWVFLNTSSLFMLYFFGKFPFIFPSNLILLPLFVCAITKNMYFWVPIRIFSLYSTCFFNTLDMSFPYFHLVNYGVFNLKDALIRWLGYSNFSIVLFSLNCLAFVYLLYDRSKRRKYILT